MTMKQMDIWTLIENGHFEQACEKADLEYEQTGNIFPLRNKVYALFHLGKYEECVELTEQLIKLRNGETSVDFLFCGIANWLLDRKRDAVLLWHRGEQSIYKDAAGGMDLEIVLYFSAIKISDNLLKAETIKKIKKLVKSKRAANWPGPLGNYLLGDIADDILLSYVSNIPVLKERHLCQAFFAMAIKCLEQADIEGYKRNLQNSISYGPSSYLEQMYYLAKGELG